MRVRRNVGRAVIVGVILVGQAAAVGASVSGSPPQEPAVDPLNGPQNPVPSAYQVEWIANTVPTLMEAGRDHTASLTIRNSGSEPWSAGTLFAIYRWNATGTANAEQFASLSLPTVLSVVVPPGQEVTLDRVRIRPPATPGRYLLTFVLDDGRRWFETSGTAALSVGVTVAPQGGALTDAGYKVAWTAIDIPKTMASGFDHVGRVAFRNISPELWPAGAVLASYHWYGSGTMLSDLAPQTRIPFPIPPGQEAQVDNLLILPPRQPGNYELQVTLVNQTAWFETKGAATVTVPVTVTPGRAGAGPFINEEVAGPMSLVLWVVLGVLLASAVIASRVSAGPLAHALLRAGAVTAVLLSTIPVLSAPVQHLALQPFPDAPQYADAARHIAQGKGFVTTIHGTDPVTPMHSPGFSTLLAPFTAIGDYPRNVQTAVQWFAVAYVGAAALVAWQLAGPLAAVFTAVILAVSPFARISGTVVLSDLFAVLLVLIVVMTLVTRISPWRVFTAGLIGGILVCVRLNMVTALLPLPVIVPRRHWKTLALGAVPPLAALALFQWLTWGSPLTTGYDVWVPDLKMFDLAHATAPAPRIGQGNVWLFPDRLSGGLMEWVCPCPPGGPQAALSNLWFYPAAVFGAFWVFTPPLIPVIGLVYAWRHRKEPTARYALLLTALTIGLQTFYYTQEARFAAAPATLLGIYGAVAGARAFRRRSAIAAEDAAALAAPVVYQRRERAPAVPLPERADDAWPGGAVGAERVRPSFRLSVIVPVFNERFVVGASLRRLLALEHDLINALEVIVVDDGSTDGTREVLEQLADRDPRVILVRHPQNRGKGAAVRTGIDHANGDITMIHDADLEYHPEDIPALLVPFQREGADAVFGSRYLSSPYRRALMHRHTMMNRTLTFVSNWFTDLNLTDLETCYKAVNTTLLKSIPLRSDDFRIEVEVPFKLAKRGARIYEVPVRYSPRTRHEGKKIRARDGILALRGMVHFAVIDDLYKRDEYGSQILVSLERARRFNSWMAEKVRPFVGTRVLEIGAGIGTLTSHFIPRDLYVASDINPHYLHYLRSYTSGKPYLHVRRIDVTRADDFTSLQEQFDTAIMLNVLEHVPEEAAALRGLWSALQPGGRAVILVPRGPSLFGTLDTALEHRERYTPARLRHAIESVGFQVESLFDFHRVSVPGWWVNGKVLRRRTFSRIQLKVLDVLTPVLKRIDRFWPWQGLSLIVVARKPGAAAPADRSIERQPARTAEHVSV